MQAWVILSGNGYPVAVRDSEAAAIATAEQMGRNAIAANEDYTDRDAETAVIVPDIDEERAGATRRLLCENVGGIMASKAAQREALVKAIAGSILDDPTYERAEAEATASGLRRAIWATLDDKARFDILRAAVTLARATMMRPRRPRGEPY